MIKKLIILIFFLLASTSMLMGVSNKGAWDTSINSGNIYNWNFLSSDSFNYDFIFTVTPTPLRRYDFDNIKEAVDTASTYTSDSIKCLVRVLPGIYHCYQKLELSNIDIIGEGDATIVLDSLPGASEFMWTGNTTIANLTIRIEKVVGPDIIISLRNYANRGITKLHSLEFYFDLDTLGMWLKSSEHLLSNDSLYMRNIKILGTAGMKTNGFTGGYLKVENFYWKAGNYQADVYPIRASRAGTSKVYLDNIYVEGCDPTDSTYDNSIGVKGKGYVNNIYMKNTKVCLGVGTSAGDTVYVNNATLYGGVPIKTSNVVLYITNSIIDGKTTLAGFRGIIEGSGTINISDSRLINHGQGGVIVNNTPQNWYIDNCYLYDDGTANGIIDGRGTVDVYNSTLIQASTYGANGADMLRIDRGGTHSYYNCYIRNKRGNVFVSSRPDYGAHYMKFKNCTMISDSSRVGWIEDVSASYDIECHIEDCNLYAQNLANDCAVATHPAGILIKHSGAGRNITLSVINSFITSIGPPIWRFNNDYPCSIYVENTDLEVRSDSVYSIFSSVAETNLTTVIGNSNEFNRPIDPVYVAPTDTMEHYGVNRFNGPVIGEKLNSGFFFQELLQATGSLPANSGNNTEFYNGFDIFSSDSFILDSLRIIWRTNQNDVYIDSVALYRGITRMSWDNTLLMGDGTNYGAGTATYAPVTYVVNQTISFDWRLQVKFWVATSGVAGAGYCHSVKAYCHY